MPLPVIADTYQIRLNWHDTDAPRDASNSLYFFDASGTQTVANLQTDFSASVVSNQWYCVATSANVSRYDITPLDGVSATTSLAIGAGAPWAGQGGTDLILQGSAVVTTKTLTRGKSARGRIYLPWIAELQQTNGVLNTSNVATMQTAWNTFKANMLTAGWTPVVVSPTLGTSYAISQYLVRPNLQIQRRRGRR